MDDQDSQKISVDLLMLSIVEFSVDLYDLVYV